MTVNIGDFLWNAGDIETLMGKTAAYQEVIEKINSLVSELRKEFEVLSHSVSTAIPPDSEESQLVRESSNTIVRLNNELIDVIVAEIFNRGRSAEPKIAETDSVIVKKVEKEPNTERAINKIPGVKVPHREP